MRYLPKHLTRWILAAVVAGCGGAEVPEGPDPGTEPLPAACAHVTPTSCVEPPPMYADVEPIFQARCADACHSGIPNGPWPLDTYGHIADWRSEVRAFVDDCSMPPRDSGVVMPDAERELVLMWLLCGLHR